MQELQDSLTKFHSLNSSDVVGIRFLRHVCEMEGYEKIAGLMARHHDLAILRRFNTLNMKDLLYRQAELVHLESELYCIAEGDQGIPDRTFYARDWCSLAESEDDDKKRQWLKMLQIQEKLKAYSMFRYFVVLLSNF
jgi:hypothetical protein